jgi:beta-mannosidase
MVWMDFNFSTMLYPDNPDMLESIKAEAEQNIRRIAKHPCVVLWCGNNEVKNGWEDWGWQRVYNWTQEQRARLQHGIDTLFGEDGILAQAVRECDPMHRPYIATSPLYGWGHPECVTHGDSHYWGVWWGEEPFEKYAEKTGRFMSEYGFQSYPMMSTIRRFCPENQLDIDSPTLRSHQKHGRGREIIDKAMMQYYGFDSKRLPLEDYVYVSQLLQAWGTGYGIYQHIKQQPHCMGTLYWQLNDCWPVASWSSIDYYGNWKALHYRAQALYTTENFKKWDEYYSVYPKNRKYPDPKYKLTQAWESDGTLVVTLKAESDLYDLYIDTEPHIDGHFTSNFVDLKSGDKLTTRLIPADPSADVSQVKVKARTLNELYFYRK